MGVRTIDPGGSENSSAALGGYGAAQRLRLNLASVGIHRTLTVAYPSDRPRKSDRKTLKGTSDHLPVVATLDY